MVSRVASGLLLALFLCPVVFAETEAVSQEEGPESQQAVRLGVFPYVTPVQLVRFHTPLHRLIEQVLEREAVLVSAPSFSEFVKRTREHKYDFILTAPHLGRLAQVRDGYRPIAKTLHDVQGVYLVRADSPVQTLEDLEGGTITMVGRAAIITQMVEYQLKELGLRDGENIEFRITKTHNNAMYAPLRGESDASVTGILLWRKIGQAERDKVRVIATTPVAPGFILMAAPGVSPGEVERIQEAAFAFADSEQGAEYFEMTGFKAFAPITEQEMEALDPYIEYFMNR